MYVRPLAFDLEIDKAKLAALVAPLDRVALAEQLSEAAVAFYWDLSRVTLPEAQANFIASVGTDALASSILAQLAENDDLIIVEPVSLSTTLAFVLAHARGVAKTQSTLKLIGAVTFETLRKPGTSEMRYDELASLLASARLGSERYLNVVWRLHELIAYARSPEGKTHHAFVDLDADFRSYLGMTYEDWGAALMMLEILFDKPASSARGRPSILTVALGAIDSHGTIRSVLLRLTASLTAVRALVDRAELISLREAVSSFLLRHPFVEVELGRVVLAAPQALDNALAMGWVYAIADARRMQDPKMSLQLWIFFGAFFESYIGAIFARVAQSISGAVWSGVKTAWGDVDVAIADGESLILCEIVSGRMSEAVLNDPANKRAVEEQLTKVLYEKADQVGEHARRFLTGELTLPGVDHRKIRNIYPLVVQFRSIPREEPMERLIEERTKAALDGCDKRVRGIEILDAESIEGLEQHLRAGIALGRLIDEKLADRTTAVMSFKNFLYFKHPELPLQLPEDISARVKAWQGELFERAKTWWLRDTRPLGTGLE